MTHALIRYDLLIILALAALTGCVPAPEPEPEADDPDPFELDEDFDAGGSDESDTNGSVGEDAGGPDGQDTGGVDEEDAGGPDEQDAGGPDEQDAGGPDMGGELPLDAPLGGARPARVTLPSGYDNSREVPLVIALHGFGGYSMVQVDFKK